MTTSIDELRALLDQVCGARQTTSPAAVVKLEENLLAKKYRLVDLLDGKPQNADHRKSLEAGKAIIGGKEYKINYEFSRQAIFISDHLNIDEYEASRLWLAGQNQASIVNSTPLDTAVYLYHAERGYVLAIFNAILEAAKDVSIENSIRYVFSSFMGDIVKEKPSSGSSFINKIITSAKHLSKMSSTISKDGMLESGKKAAENQQRLRDAKYREEFEKQHHRQLFDHAIMQPDEPLVFKPETIKLRVDQLDEERITLMQILYYISTLYWLPEDDLIAILTKVQSMNLSDNNASYMLTALLAALSFEYTSPPNSRQGVNFSTNNTFLKKLHDQITTKTWKVDALKAVVSIQWALFVQVLYRTKPDIDQALSFNKNARISLVKSAIALDAFGYMNNYLLHFKQKLEARDRKQTIKDINDDDSAMALDGLIVDPNDYTKFNVDISDDFQRFVVHELETLTESFIFNMSDIFSHLKSKASGEEMMESQASNDLKEEINNTFIKFLALLASIYRNRRDAGLKFWNNERLSYFLAFLADLKLPGNLHLPATFDFMGSISTGVESADYSYAKFKIGTNTNNIGESSSFSWGKLFSAYQFFNKEFQKHKSEDMPPIFSALEEEMLIKFSYLCQQVVQYSNDGRKELWSSPVLAAHSSIVELIACPLSSQFRAALYDLLAAFTSHWGGGINDVGKSCAKDVWMTLERSDMIISNKVMVRQEPATAASTTTTITPSANTLYNGYSIITPVSTVSSSTPPNPVQKYLLPEQPAGFLRVFEDEKNLRVYTETQSVLHLMANLIHTPSKRDELINAFSLIEPSVPYLLGHDNNRTPGTSPYISLVVDHVFLNLKNLKYDNPDTQWQLADACLTIIENSIMSFNIEPLCDYIRYTSSDNKMTVANVLGGASPQAASIKQSTLQDSLLTYVTQPGYDVLVGILSGNALVHELFKIVAKGKEAIAQSKTDENDYFRKCLTRCLRIFSKVFKIQNAFVNIFMPQLHITSTKQEMGQFKLGDYVFPSPPSSLRSLGSLMLFNTEVIVQMAVLVDSDDYEDICALSVSVLADLASQPEDCSSDTQLNNHINAPMGGIGSRQLAGILLSSPKASSIIFGVSERLEVETAERTTYDDYEYDMNIIPFWLAEKTLGNIYRFDDFNDNYHPSRSIRITILDMLLKNMGKELQSPTITEFLLGYDVKDLETFGVQRKSIPTDVQHRSQLACLLAILEMLRRGTDDDENYDGEQEIPLIRTHPVLAERCYQLIFKLCATESTSTATLYYLRTNCDDFLVKQFKSIACRLETCVGVSEPCFEGTLVSADKTVVSTDFLTMVSVLNQRAWLLKLIALELHMTANTSHRNGTVTLLELLYGIADHSTSPAIEDILVQQMESMKLQLDTNYQQPLWNMLEIVNSLEFTWNDALDEGPAEPLVYFRTFTAEKYKTQKDGYALYDIRTVYKILRQHQLTDPFCASLADGERHAMEAEMGRILKRLTAENHHLEINYGRLHCLRAWKQVVEITISDCFDLFSFGSREKIIYDLLTVLLPKLEYGSGLNNEILKGLSEIVLSLLKRLREDKRRQEILQVAPGSVAAQFRLPDEKLRLIFTSIINCICKVTIEIRSSMYSSLVNLLQYISPNVSTQQNDASFRNIRSDIINIVGGECKGKLLDTICGDANNALAIYNTTAFMALQALYDLLSKNKDTMIHQYLVKKNFLQYNVDMIKQSDFELNKIIQERDAPLDPLYNYEAKMSLFMQIASNTEGASLLLSNGILNSLAHLKFVNARFAPCLTRDLENNFKVDKHRRLLKPVLELVITLLTSIPKEEMEMGQLETWTKKQDVIVYILKGELNEKTLSSLYVLQLTTSLIYQLSCQPYYFEELDTKGLNQLDSLMISLIPKYCVSKYLATTVVPTGFDEDGWAKQSVVDDDDQQVSMLASKADRYIADIRNNLLAYAFASTFRKHPVAANKKPFKPIFSNTLQSIDKEVPSQYNRAASMTPSLTTLVTCLASNGKKLAVAIENYKNLCAQKENVASLKYEETLEIANTAIPKGLGIKFEGLNQNQKIHVLATEIRHRLESNLKEIDDLFFTIENASFILWRHLEFYLSRGSISNSMAFSPCSQRYEDNVVLRETALYQTSSNVIGQLKPACRSVLEPVIKKLEMIPTTMQTSSKLPEVIKRLRKCYD